MHKAQERGSKRVSALAVWQGSGERGGTRAKSDATAEVWRQRQEKRPFEAR